VAEAKDTEYRWQSLKRYVNKVPHYLTGRELMDEWKRRNPAGNCATTGRNVRQPVPQATWLARRGRVRAACSRLS
jgi:hypothetical protein